MLSLSLPFASSDAEAVDGFAPNAFIRIGGDGQIVLTMPYVEMGQGTYTSIPMLIAEELEVDLGQLRLEHATGSAFAFVLTKPWVSPQRSGRKPGSACSGTSPRCWLPARPNCTASARPTAPSGSASPFISPRRVPGGCSGRWPPGSLAC